MNNLVKLTAKLNPLRAAVSAREKRQGASLRVYQGRIDKLRQVYRTIETKTGRTEGLRALELMKQWAENPGILKQQQLAAALEADLATYAGVDSRGVERLAKIARNTDLKVASQKTLRSKAAAEGRAQTAVRFLASLGDRVAAAAPRGASVQGAVARARELAAAPSIAGVWPVLRAVRELVPRPDGGEAPSAILELAETLETGLANEVAWALTKDIADPAAAADTAGRICDEADEKVADATQAAWEEALAAVHEACTKHSRR